MTLRPSTMCATLALSATMMVMCGLPAAALTAKECSAKYQAAKSAGTLAGKTWNDYRKTECGEGAAAAPAPAPTTSPGAPAGAPAKKSARAPAEAPAPSGNAVFPKAIDPKYSKESPGKARQQTCLDQYRANKTSNGNGGLKWIQKGGGYYSECNKQLKG